MRITTRWGPTPRFLSLQAVLPLPRLRPLNLCKYSFFSLFLFFLFILHTLSPPWSLISTLIACRYITALHFCWYCWERKRTFDKNWNFADPAEIKSLCVNVYTFYTSFNFAFLILRMLLYYREIDLCQFLLKTGGFSSVDKKLFHAYDKMKRKSVL